MRFKKGDILNLFKGLHTVIFLEYHASNIKMFTGYHNGTRYTSWVDNADFELMTDIFRDALQSR